MNFVAVSLAVALSGIASAAAAAPAYFHKAGVARDAFAEDVAICEGLAGGVDVRRTTAYSSNPYAAGVGGLLSGITASRERRAIVESVLRTCMADRAIVGSLRHRNSDVSWRGWGIRRAWNGCTQWLHRT